MRLAVFDLDNTLLNGDSDYSWGRFLVTEGVVDADVYARENNRFFNDYNAGTLDVHAYVAFMSQPLVQQSSERMLALRERYVREQVAPMVARGAPELLDQHRAAGDVIVLTTATNRFVVEPIATLLGIEHLIATDPEIVDGRYTGHIAGTPNFQDGKVVRLQQWIAQQSKAITQMSAYSDSRNDIPLLEMADRAVAVDPDDTLRAEANARGWAIISLR